ncbi:hypothetical protein GCM10018966_053730 [Streptomyces yanii]
MDAAGTGTDLRVPTRGSVIRDRNQGRAGRGRRRRRTAGRPTGMHASPLRRTGSDPDRIRGGPVLRAVILMNGPWRQLSVSKRAARKYSGFGSSAAASRK